MGKLKILLLESIHPVADELLEAEGFEVQRAEGALKEDQLCERLKGIHLLGIRSKTQVTKKVLDAADSLIAVGAFCIGTNQIALDHAMKRGVAVFNAPFSNTRSVAEMVIAEIVMLSRHLGDRSREMHHGVWKKVATGSREVRGKTLGVVGYGHIGSQVSILAEDLGMRVVFHDIAAKLPLGNSQPVKSLEALLEQSDFVTLHVPETPQTRGMIGAAQLARMKKGACLINASRGHGGGPRRARPGAQGEAARRRGARRLPGGARGQQRRGLRDAAPRPAQRHPHPAHRRLDPRGPGGDRPRGLGQPLALRPHRRDARVGELPAGRPRRARRTPGG